MSKFEDGSYGSLTGIALIGKVLAGRCKIRYTRATVGSGKIPDDMTPKTMAGSAEYVMDAKIATVTNPVDGECQVTVQIRSDDVETGFYATNIVLFAEDPDDGEVPFTYLSLENEPEWIRPASSIVGKLATFDLIAAVGDVDAVSAIIDPEAIATVGHVEQMLENHNKDPNSHGGMAKIVSLNAIIPAEGWEENTDTGGLFIDIPAEGVTDDIIPIISIAPGDGVVAAKCGLSDHVETGDGYIRLYAKTTPEREISADIVLLSPSKNISSGSSGFITELLPATDTRLGGVKIGNGVSVTDDGTISVTTEGITATDEDAANVIDEIFGEK